MAKQRKGIRIFHFRPMPLILLILDRFINLISLRSNYGNNGVLASGSERALEYWV
jgi:hypothetical protein